MKEYVEIVVKKKIVENRIVSEIANVLICISVLLVVYILFNVLPGEYNTDYMGDVFFIDNIYSILATCLMLIIGIILKVNNYKKVFGMIKFYDEKVQLSDKAKTLIFKLEDIERIRYSFYDPSVDRDWEKDRHWITIKPKEQKEFSAEFLGDNIQIDLIKILTKYKSKGNDIEINRINY